MKFAYLIEPPFNFVDEFGKVTGCDVELARHVLQQIGVEDVEFVQTEFAQLLPGLGRGDWQMTTGLFASDDRRRHALFSNPIWALPDGLLISVAHGDRITGYRSIAEMHDLRIAVVRSQLQHQTALTLGVSPDQILVFETYVDAAKAVQDGRVDAYASVARAHEGYLRNTDNRNLALMEVPSGEKPPDLGCFAFAQTNTALKNRFDNVLKEFIGGPEHRRLMNEFGFNSEDVDRLLASTALI